MLTFISLFILLDCYFIFTVNLLLVWLFLSVLHPFSENKKLQEDLQKVEQLENKAHQEIKLLETKIEKMKEELEQYQDIQGLKQRSEQRKEVCALIGIN